MAKAILITGTGNVGKNIYWIANKKAKQGDDYYDDIWTLDIHPFPENKKKHIQVDLTDRKAVVSALKGKKFYRVIHTAAVLLPSELSSDSGKKDINYKVNVEGTINLLWGLYKNNHPLESFCVSGTYAIYNPGKIPPEGASEDTPLIPKNKRNSYVHSKVEQIKRAKRFIKEKFGNAKFTSPQYTWLYGPEDVWYLGGGAHISSILAFLNMKTIILPEGGKFHYGALCGENAADATLYVERYGKHEGIYNVNGINISVKELVKRVANMKGIELYTEDEALNIRKNLSDTSYALLVGVPRTLSGDINSIKANLLFLKLGNLVRECLSLEFTVIPYLMCHNVLNTNKLKRLGWKPRCDEFTKLDEMINDRLKNDKSISTLLKAFGPSSKVLASIQNLISLMAPYLKPLGPAMESIFRSVVLMTLRSYRKGYGKL